MQGDGVGVRTFEVDVTDTSDFNIKRNGFTITGAGIPITICVVATWRNRCGFGV